MFKDMSKIMTWYIWMVTYLRRNVTISNLSWDSKIRFDFKLNLTSAIGAWEIFDQPCENPLDKPNMKMKIYLSLNSLNGHFQGKS